MLFYNLFIGYSNLFMWSLIIYTVLMAFITFIIYSYYSLLRNRNNNIIYVV